MANLHQISVLYKTDFHHSYASRDLIGVFTNKRLLLAAIKKLVKQDLKADPQGKEGGELTDYINWNISFLLEKGQTQGLSSFELVCETVPANQLF